MRRENEIASKTKRTTHKILLGAIAAVLIFMAIQLGYLFSINNLTNEVGIEGSNIKFKTPGYVITMIKGKLDEKVKSEETGAVQYVYDNQTLFGQTGMICYECLMGVYEVTAIIPVEPEQREEKFHDICNYMCEIYVQKEGYYDECVMEEDGMIYRNLGAEFGTTGIEVRIVCEEDTIEIVANYQY